MAGGKQRDPLTVPGGDAVGNARQGEGGDGRELRPQHTQAAGVTRGTEKPSDAVMTTHGDTSRRPRPGCVCAHVCTHVQIHVSDDSVYPENNIMVCAEYILIYVYVCIKK